MQNFEEQLRTYPKPYITDYTVATLLTGKSADSRYSKIKRMVEQHKLTYIRRGLYLISNQLQNHLYHSFEIAQQIYAPSYISLESAMSYHQLIPEAVRTVTSVTPNRNKEFDTPIGLFSYSTLPLKNFFLHAKLIKEANNSFIVATPWMAIFDYVYCYKKDWKSLAPLFDSLRVDKDALPEPDYAMFSELIEYYNRRRLTKFITIAQEEYYEH